jgi:hypothetical protein
MGATQGELEQRLTHEEWTEWLRYRRVNPPDQARMDYRFGQLCAVLCAVNGNKDAKASDFIPDYRKAHATRPGELRPEEIQMVNIMAKRIA